MALANRVPPGWRVSVSVVTGGCPRRCSGERAREHIAQFIVLMFKGGAQTVEEFRGGLERLRAA